MEYLDIWYCTEVDYGTRYPTKPSSTPHQGSVVPYPSPGYNNLDTVRSSTRTAQCSTNTGTVSVAAFIEVSSILVHTTLCTILSHSDLPWNLSTVVAKR